MGSVKKLQPFFRKIVPWLIVFLIIPAASGLYAGQGGEDEISWVFLVINLLGGLAFFLYGMDKMSSGMKKTAGNQMRMILSALTKNRMIALLVGAFVTMVIQSSSATTVMLVSFVQAGLMSFTQSLGVILGADIGTTVTAQMIAFKLTDYALLMIVAGFGMRFFTKSDHIRNIGEIIIGFGILFYGMKLMSDAMAPLRTHSLFVDLMKGLTNPLYGLLIGMVSTALLQSSSAFTGIVIVLAQQGLIQLEAGIPLIFGSNIGTCITAMLASMSARFNNSNFALLIMFFLSIELFIMFFLIGSAQ
jgi:phosphate:Na+ symporter